MWGKSSFICVCGARWCGGDLDLDASDLAYSLINYSGWCTQNQPAGGGAFSASLNLCSPHFQGWEQFVVAGWLQLRGSGCSIVGK